MSRALIHLTGLLLALAGALVATPKAAAAQDPCPPEALDCAQDTIPPTIIIAPATRDIFSNAPLAFTIKWCDQLGMINYWDQRWVRWRGAVVTGSFQDIAWPDANVPYNCNQRQAQTATLSPHPGSNVISAYLMDDAGNSTVQSETFTYDIVDVIAARGQSQRGANAASKSRLWVKNVGAEQYSYVMRPSCSNATLCSVAPTSATIASHDSAYVDITYTTGAVATESIVGVIAKYSADTTVFDSGAMRISVVPANFAVAVTPRTKSMPGVTSTTSTAKFFVRNAGNAGTSYQITATCATGATACSAPATTSTVFPGDSATVTVSFNPGTAAAGTVSLRAVAGSARDSGTYTVRAQGANMPHVALDSLGVGTVTERSACVIAGAGLGAAYECGDLRLAHALPTVKTLNKARTPVLLYNSAHANAAPLVGAYVSLPAGASLPTTVIGRLRSGGVTYDSARWPGSEWTAGTTRRIALRAKGISQGQTILAPIVFSVTFDYGTSQTSDSVSASVVIIDRTKSAFGPGWWLAGLERLIPIGGVSGDSLLLWIGGDGSARRYVKRASSLVWTTDLVDRPDTLTRVAGGNYVRHLPHGVKVKFDGTGRHIATANRVGDTTFFRYAGAALQLDSIVVPSASAPLRYAFQYTDSVLRSVVIPGVTGARAVQLTHDASRRISAIMDLDSTSVGFQFASAASPRITARIDRNGTRTAFTYDSAAKLSSALVEMQGTAPSDIVTNYRPAESRGFLGASTPASIAEDRTYTMLDGPRTDVADTTMIWVNRFGAPRMIRDPLGLRTEILRENGTYPMLVTRVRTPRGFTTAAAYDALGALRTSVDSATYTVSGSVFSYATTRYEWDPTWQMATKVVAADGRDSTLIRYDPATGNRLSQRNALNDSVTFAYTSHGRVSAVRHQQNVPGTGWLTDSIAYDATLGNVASSWTPRGVRTSMLEDAFGRDTLVTGQINATARDTTTITYDWAGQVRTTWQRAPGIHYSYYVGDTPISDSTAAEGAWTVNAYDPEGNLLTVKRGAIPNINALDTIVTTFSYDRASRKTSETNASTTSYSYDAAGNVTSVDHGGLRTTTTYDVANRPARRIAASVRYADPGFQLPIDNRFPQPRFPEYYWTSPPALGGATQYIVPADTATFAYDSLGNLLEAKNADAWVFRSYKPNGALADDTLKVRTVATLAEGGNFRQHVYALHYDYDIAGRRIQRSGVGPTATYRYDALGRLDTLQSSSGNLFRFSYTRAGQLDTLAYPDQVFQVNRYDDDGRRTLRTEWRGTTVFHADTTTYDERGKVITVGSVAASVGSSYSGLGMLRHSKRQSEPAAFDTADEYFTVDALGYQASRATGPIPAQSMLYRYRASNGQHIATAPPANTSTQGIPLTSDTTIYDAAGNRNIYLSQTVEDNNSQFETSVYIYDGNGRLRIADVRRCSNTYGMTCVDGVPLPSGAFEEYRYDALGRRVWVRARKDNRCAGSMDDCTSTITRTAWDGNEIVAEYRTLGGNTTTEGERDDGGSSAKTGKITYLSGLTIDQPLEVTRNGARVVPYINWRGLADQGSYGTCHDFEHTGTPSPCGSVEWPAGRLEIYYTLKNGVHRTVGTYWGSLLQEGEDASGQLYRRNRYYDPTSGKFTQEDPIGIAGGLNVYGYANGDPVNHSDPFGLCEPYPECLYGWGSLLDALGIHPSPYPPTSKSNVVFDVGIGLRVGFRETTFRPGGKTEESESLDIPGIGLSAKVRGRDTTVHETENDATVNAARGPAGLSVSKGSVEVSAGLGTPGLPGSLSFPVPEKPPRQYHQAPPVRPDATAVTP